MDNSSQITESNKNYTYNLLADILYNALEEESITREEAEEAATTILDTIETISTYNELMSFLETLSSRWPAFNKAIVTIKEEGLKAQDQQKIEQARQQLANFKQA